MSPLELTDCYLKSFFGQAPIQDLKHILHDNLRFRGPFLNCDSASVYIKAIEADPMENATYAIVDEFEKENSACVIYELSKTDINVLVSQWFKIEDGKIIEILTLFDSEKFKLRNEH